MRNYIWAIFEGILCALIFWGFAVNTTFLLCVNIITISALFITLFSLVIAIFLTNSSRNHLEIVYCKNDPKLKWSELKVDLSTKIVSTVENWSNIKKSIDSFRFSSFFNITIRALYVYALFTISFTITPIIISIFTIIILICLLFLRTEVGKLFVIFEKSVDMNK